MTSNFNTACPAQVTCRVRASSSTSYQLSKRASGWKMAVFEGDRLLASFEVQVKGVRLYQVPAARCGRLSALPETLGTRTTGTVSRCAWGGWS